MDALEKSLMVEKVESADLEKEVELRGDFWEVGNLRGAEPVAFGPSCRYRVSHTRSSLLRSEALAALPQS